MNPFVLAGVIALIVISLGIFAIREIRALAKQAGAGEAREELSDEAFQAQTRRQKMARRARARGRRLVERMQKWGRSGRS